MKQKTWFYVAIICLVVSILSMFTSVVSYTTASGEIYHYSIIDLIQGSRFTNQVLNDYSGTVVWDIGNREVTILSVIAFLSVLCAVIGLVTLRAQRPNKWQFLLTIIGLIGVSVPSVLILFAVVAVGSSFHGTLSCSVAPVLTPIAMIISICAVVRRRNKVLEQLRQELTEKGLIHQAGDLE